MTPSIVPTAEALLVRGDVVIAAGLGDDGGLQAEFTVRPDIPTTPHGLRLQRLMTLVMQLFEATEDPTFLKAIEQFTAELPQMLKNARRQSAEQTNCSCEKCRRARGEQPLQPTTH